MLFTVRWRIVAFFAVVMLTLVLFSRSGRRVTLRIPDSQPTHVPPPLPHVPEQGWNENLDPPHEDSKFDWSKVSHKYPVSSFIRLPTPIPGSILQIQASFKRESSREKRIRLQRLAAVKGNFTHAWYGYKTHAWLRDEVAPISGRGFDHFGGWAATLVDSLDTLWIMGMYEEFELAVKAVNSIDFSTCALDEINVFETTIRYLGGFLAAYDLSERKYPILLRKAEEMGLMLYKAFDTPNRMPITRWKFKDAIEGKDQVASESMLLAEIGSLSLEFTRLSQLTGDLRYYDAIQRIMDIFDAQQNSTKLPGMWPIVGNAKTAKFNEYGVFTLGGMADSAFEYLPKEYLLLGGGSNQYRKMYEDAYKAMSRNIFYRPMIKDQKDILFAGTVEIDGNTPVNKLSPRPEAQHLGCFAGGMVGIAAKIFGHDDQMETARKLMEGCLWGYEAMSQGVLPEIVYTLKCNNKVNCPWDEQQWLDAMATTYEVKGKEAAEQKQSQLGLPFGILQVKDGRYILRPEAIESIFILYRLTGDHTLQDRAWRMFETIILHSITDIAHAALDDCTVANPPKADRMESFWLAETLKYFYLIFSEPDIISLDHFVFNTEAHPLRRPE